MEPNPSKGTWLAENRTTIFYSLGAVILALASYYVYESYKNRRRK